MEEPRWILAEVVLAIHRRQLAEHGGIEGVADLGLLESAVARAQQLFCYGDPPPDLATLAAAYAYEICKNHAFRDGNKRTALVVCRTFLLMNGADIRATRRERYETFIQLADGTMDEDELAAWIRERLTENDGAS